MAPKATSASTRAATVASAATETLLREAPNFMNVRQVAEYLHINEKKVSSLVSEGKLPASKLTGKWLFPRQLVDQWVLESTHGGLLTDRLLISGSDDPLIARVTTLAGNELRGNALLSYSTTGTQLGLSLLARRRADVSLLRWGVAEESHFRHPALIRQYAPHHDWVLVRICRREQGLILAPGLWTSGIDIPALFSPDVRWAARQEGTGSQRFFQEIVARHRVNPSARRITVQANTEREAASMVAMGPADVVCGARAAAGEFGLDFHPIGWEALDAAMHRGIFFRRLFQRWLDHLRHGEAQRQARMLGGYDFGELGNLVWPL